MSATSPTPIPLSYRITNPLKDVSQRQWTVLAARGILRTLVVSLAMLLAVSLLLGWWTSAPVPLKIALALIAWVTVIWAAVNSLRPALQRWSLSRAAQFAEQSIPDNEERISSAVELSESEDQFRGSPELVAHLVKQAEQDVARVNIANVVPFSSILRWFVAFVPVLALWFVFAVNSHTNRMVLRGLFSALRPWEAPPVILADVVVKPGDITLAQGDPLMIIATVSPNGGKLPKNAKITRTFPNGQQSQVLTQTGALEFTLNLENQTQSFQYQVDTDRGVSPKYSVTVNPRPAVAALDVHYDYPKYTGLEPKTLARHDGSIDAVVGTKVILTVHTTDAVVLDKSQIVFNEPDGKTTPIALTPTAAKNVYEAKMDVAHTGNYSIKLLNEYNLANRDNDLHPVTAELDQAPSIAIISPREQITVRPDDEVSIMYEAGDDYAVAHIEALVQVDEKPEFSVPITIHGKNHKSIKETWNLSVASILKRESAADASRISYQLKATDNRDPDPQTALSDRQTLLISKTEKKSFQDKLNEIRKEDLEAAIKKAIARLTSDGYQVRVFEERQARIALVEEQKAAVALVRDHVSNTGKDLSATAGEFFDTPFAEVAKKARTIADTEIHQAADDTALIAIAADRAAGVQNAHKAYGSIITSRDDLQKLLKEVEDAAKKAEAVQDLKDAAKKQEEVAKAMEEHPELAEQNLKKQQEAIAKLNEALQKDTALQNQKAVEQAKALAELENKIEQDQQKQTELQNQTAKQEEKQQAQEAANAIAEEQKKLNKEVQQFAKDDKQALEQAKAVPPDANKQDQLVKNIENNQLPQAAAQAQQAADQLKQDAQKLADQAKANTPATPQQQKQQQQDQQNAQQAQKQADKAAQQLKQEAKKPDAQTAKQAAENTEKAAKAIAKQADQIEQQNQKGANDPNVQKTAEAAKADAQQAAQDAQAAAQAQDPKDAQKDADKAAQEVAKAGQELAEAAGAEAKADQAQAQQQNQQAAAKAAEKAQGLAQAQQQIAQALAQQAQQQADAAKAATPQQAAQQQQQLAEQTQQAQQAAKQLAQQAQADKNQNLAKRADDAGKALDQAAKDQQQAAQADAQNKPADAAQAQADAQQALAKAEQALRGVAEAAQAQAQADPAQAQAQAQAQEQGQPQQAQGQPEQGQGKPEQGQGQPQQTAAQAAQEAHEAQKQTALQPNPAAAAEAAQALAQAAQAAQQGLPGQEQGNEPGHEEGNHPGEQPHAAADPKQGIQGDDASGNNKVPGSVAALGINASDWAKLPPLMQRELMNASQQSGPASYKEMIKNYYVRVARMQSDQGAKR